MAENENCDCGESPIWIYLPSSTGNNYFCDECVPRGCSCNRESFEFESVYGGVGGYKGYKGTLLEDLLESGEKFRIVDNMLKGEPAPYLSHKSAIRLDERGREYPCCEYEPIHYEDTIA